MRRVPASTVTRATLRRVADRPTWLLARAHARASGLLRQAVEAEGVRGYHFRLLAALEEYGASSRADLGRATGIDRLDAVLGGSRRRCSSP